MMQLYTRTTEIVDFKSLPAPLLAALQAYAEKHELGDLAAAVRLCGLTRSKVAKRSFFQRLLNGLTPGSLEEDHDTAIVLTGDRLFWASHGAKRGAPVLSARLREIEVKDFNRPGVDDQGLDVFGFFEGATEKGLTFIGLGSDAAAARLRAAIKEAIAAA